MIGGSPPPHFQWEGVLGSKMVSCRQHIDGSGFFIHSDNLGLLLGAFSPFTFRVITEIYGFSVIVLSVGFMLVVMSLVLCSLCCFPLRVPLRISCRAGLVVMRSFSFVWEDLYLSFYSE